MIIMNIATILICLTMLVLFRKADKANAKMGKFRRYSKKTFDDFKKLAELESRKYQDSTIEMDILIKKSSALTSNMAESLNDMEKRILLLNEERSNLSQIEQNVLMVSNAAGDVNKQIEYISAAKKNFAEITDSVKMLTQNISGLKNEASAISIEFASKLRDRSRDLSDEFTDQLDKLYSEISVKEEDFIKSSEERVDQIKENYSLSLTEMEERLADTEEKIAEDFQIKVDRASRSIESAANLENHIENMRESVIELETNIFADLKERSNAVKENVNDSLNEFEEGKERLLEKLNDEISRVHGKLKTVETNVDESKSKLIETFKLEVDRVRTELDNLNLHAISKKDEIVQATRKEAEDIKIKIGNFEEKYVELERRMVDVYDERMNNLDSEYHSVELRFNSLVDKLDSKEEFFGNLLESKVEKSKREFGQMDQRLSDIKDEIIEYEESNKIFSRTDDMTNKVEEAVSALDLMLANAKNESESLEKFFGDVNEIKDLRRSVEKEIRAYQTKKEQIIDVEKEIRGLSELSDFAVNRAESVKENMSKINEVSTKIDLLSDSYSGLEIKIEELDEYEGLISKNLESINRTDMLMGSVDGKVRQIEKVVDRADKRIDKVNQHLINVEEKTLFLKSRESEIEEVTDKFNQIEDLSMHVEKRVEQIHAMFSKIETLRHEVDETDDKLQQMYTQTDTKMKQLADFIKAADDNPISKTVSGDIPASKNLNGKIIKTVRDLSESGWDASEISRKLMVDENSVRFIINTESI